MKRKRVLRRTEAGGGDFELDIVAIDVGVEEEGGSLRRMLRVVSEIAENISGSDIHDEGLEQIEIALRRYFVGQPPLGESKTPGYTRETSPSEAAGTQRLRMAITDKTWQMINGLAVTLGVPEEKRRAFLEMILDFSERARETTARTEPPRPAQRTAQELFGVSASFQTRRYRKSGDAEFSNEELDNATLLQAADRIVNDRTKRTKKGEVLSREEIDTAQRAARFSKQARKRGKELAAA